MAVDELKWNQKVIGTLAGCYNISELVSRMCLSGVCLSLKISGQEASAEDPTEEAGGHF